MRERETWDAVQNAQSLPRVHPSEDLPSEINYRVQSAGLRVQGSGFRVQGSGFRFRVQGSGFRVQGSGFSVQCSGFRVQGESGPGSRRVFQIARLRPCWPQVSKSTSSWRDPATLIGFWQRTLLHKCSKVYAFCQKSTQCVVIFIEMIFECSRVPALKSTSPLVSKSTNQPPPS